MKLDTITFGLSGDVSLDDFAKGIASFHELIRGLTEETGTDGVEWLIDHLERSSAIATVRGVGDADRVAHIVQNYDGVGECLHYDRPLTRFSSRVQKAARTLVAIPSGKTKVESVRLETAERDWIIRPPAAPRKNHLCVVPQAGQEPQVPQPAQGQQEGRVQTLTTRGGLRFTLYDLLHDKAVSCYVKEGHEDKMRDIWGKVAVVEGVISRDPQTGRANSVRQITRIEMKPEVRGSWREARGASPAKTELLPEQAIRRLRDA